MLSPHPQGRHIIGSDRYEGKWNTIYEGKRNTIPPTDTKRAEEVLEAAVIMANDIYTRHHDLPMVVVPTGFFEGASARVSFE